METQQLDARELCSRKLWELINDRDGDISATDLSEAVAELARRRRYLEELQELGKLGPDTH